MSDRVLSAITFDIEGHAVVWDKRDDNGNLWRRGAFSHCSPRNTGLMLAHHSQLSLPLLRLSLREDDVGLFFRGVVADTELTRDLSLARRAGHLSQCSISWSNDRKNRDGSIAHAYELLEVTLTSRGAQRLTSNNVTRNSTMGVYNWLSPMQKQYRIDGLLSRIDELDRQEGAQRLRLQREIDSMAAQREALAAARHRTGPRRKQSRQQLAAEFIAETRALVSDIGADKVSAFLSSLKGRRLATDGVCRVQCGGGIL